MKWRLEDKTRNAVAEVELPDDAPDIVIFEARLFHYGERVARYVTPTVYVVATESAHASKDNPTRAAAENDTAENICA